MKAILFYYQGYQKKKKTIMIVGPKEILGQVRKDICIVINNRETTWKI